MYRTGWKNILLRRLIKPNISIQKGVGFEPTPFQFTHSHANPCYALSVYFFFYLLPNPNLFSAEKIALTDALVILLETPTP